MTAPGSALACDDCTRSQQQAAADWRERHWCPLCGLNADPPCPLCPSQSAPSEPSS